MGKQIARQDVEADDPPGGESRGGRLRDELKKPAQRTEAATEGAGTKPEIAPIPELSGRSADATPRKDAQRAESAGGQALATPATAGAEQAGSLRVEDLSEKSIIVIGDPTTHKERVKRLGGPVERQARGLGVPEEARDEGARGAA
jgi:hypothetical protein